MNRPALRAKLRARVNHAERRLRKLHAARDWLGVKNALPAYWLAANDWRSCQ